MKTIVLFFLFFNFIFSFSTWARGIPAPKVPTPSTTIMVNQKKVTLAFQDNFDGTNLDYKVWEHLAKNSPRRTGWWRSDATYLDKKGNLVIKIFKDGNKYVSGGIQTVSKFKFAYGYYEARARFQFQHGAWCAFWLWPFEPEKSNAVEIDIFEYGFVPYAPQNALHWYQDGHRELIWRFPYAIPTKDWHTFGFYWDKDNMIWYMDGKPTWRQPTKGYNGYTSILFSVEIGDWAFGDIKKAILPDFFLVDYVRFYKLN
jgi:beta-glucanase (GH16 family)